MRYAVARLTPSTVAACSTEIRDMLCSMPRSGGSGGYSVALAMVASKREASAALTSDLAVLSSVPLAR